MAKRVRRKNEQLLLWLRAIAIAAFTYAGLLGMRFSPPWGAAALALGAGVLALVSADLGVTLAVLALSVPVIAAEPVIGIFFAVFAVVSIRYLGSDGARMFLLIATAVAGAFLGPVWAPMLIAGLLMGAAEGAVAAAIAGFTVEAVALVMGRSVVIENVTAAGGGDALVDFATAPNSLFSAAWPPETFGRLNADTIGELGAAIGATPSPIALAIQPLVWALGAVVVAIIASRLRSRPVAVTSLAIAAATLIPAAGTIALHVGFGLPVAWGALAWATVSSAVVAGGFSAVYLGVFPRLSAQPRSKVAADDAEVDELLQLIATAEERLATQHTTTKVVLITDVKSFSLMTEEDGSLMTAKAIQRHRDLLLPIIETHKGKGKSTGGDGLVAAFDSAFDALGAAKAMQQALHAHQAASSDGRDMSVRIGVARGEVVLDKSGRPFIGAGLNLAARIMNLADGGQIYLWADLLSVETTALHTHSHGMFVLKNIARPIEVAELLWSDDQAPQPPQEVTG